tara:strand:+ start:11698 stop:14178 length:2481 start_codon:yes stop_codon:yes gene_type:complete
MEPIQYRPTESNASFNPVNPIDYTGPLATEHERLLAAERQVLSDMQRDARTIAANDAERIKGIQEIAAFSTKATEELGQLYADNAVRERKDAFTQELLSPSAPSPDYVAGREQAESEFIDGQKVAAEVGKVDYEAAEPYRSGSVWAQMGRREAQALMAIENELPRIIEEATKQFVNLPPSEREPLINDIIADFAERKGLTGLRRSFLEDKILPEMRSVKSADAREYKTAYNKREAARQLAEVEQSLASRTPETLIPQLAAIAGDDGRPMGNTAAWDKFETLVANGVVLEIVSAEQYKAMGDAIIPPDNPGAGKRYRDFYPTRFRRIDAAIETGIVQMDRAEQGVKAKKNRELAEDIAKALLDDPDGFNRDTWERAVKLYADETDGGTSTLLENLESRTFESIADDEATEKLRDIRREGQLSVSTLKRMGVSNDVYEEFIGDAERQDEARGKSGAAPDWIEKLARTGGGRGDISSTPDGTQSPTVDGAIDDLSTYYRRAIAGYLTDTNITAAEAAQKAEKATREYFDKDPKFNVTTDGYPAFDPINNGSNTADRAAVVERQRQIEENTRRNPDYLKKGEKDIGGQAAFKKSELEAIASKYGTVNFVMPEKAKVLARIKGITPFQVLNIQLDANDLDTLPESPAVKVFQDTITPALQRLFNRNPTPAASVRVLGSAGNFSPEMIPKGYGSLIEQAAKAHDIPPSIIAGLIETESAWNPNAVSRSKAKGLAQFMDPTAAEFKVNPFDPASAIDGAAKYLRYLTDYFGGDMEKAIYAYNGGMGNVERLGVGFDGPGGENYNYFPSVMKSAYKYGYKQALSDPSLVRPAFQ